MRTITLALLAAVCSCGDASTTPAQAELKGTVYGEGVKAAESVKVSHLYDKMDEYAGRRVRVEGMVTDVCAKRGCWFSLASDKEFQTLRFKVVDGVMVFPMSMRGKYAVAEGTVKKIDLDLEQTRKFLAHKAEERGETFDPAGVTEPISFIQLSGLGVVVREQP